MGRRTRGTALLHPTCVVSCYPGASHLVSKRRSPVASCLAEKVCYAQSFLPDSSRNRRRVFLCTLPSLPSTPEKPRALLAPSRGTAPFLCGFFLAPSPSPDTCTHKTQPGLQPCAQPHVGKPIERLPRDATGAPYLQTLRVRLEEL